MPTSSSDDREPIIEFQQVSKQYQIGTGNRSLRSALSEIPGRLIGQTDSQKNLLWALQEATFSLERGESVGLVGHNGAGKTTILKLLSGITRPTLGEIHVRGRLGSLIELGAGFHPEMTGRENVYLNGVILGLTQKEVSQRFDSIVDFSEIGRFIDTPVKRYSSGMYVRLAFAVAAHIEPAVLLVDEVLAVGDVSFRAKCYRHMAELRQKGTSIMLVSHDVQAIKDVCDRAILVWGGRMLDDGSPEVVIPAYLSKMRSLGEYNGDASTVRYKMDPSSDPQKRIEASKAIIEQVAIKDLAGKPIDTITSGDGLSVDLSFSMRQELNEPIVRVDFFRSGLLVTGFSTANLDDFAGYTIGQNHIRLEIPHFTLPAGNYSISIAIVDTYAYNIQDIHHHRYHIDVAPAAEGRGDLFIPHFWNERDSARA